MRTEAPIYYEGKVYSCVYFNGPPANVIIESRDEVNWTVIDMFKKGIREQRIKRGSLKATIERRGKKGLGHYFGTYFKIEGETELGKLETGLLILDRINPKLN